MTPEQQISGDRSATIGRDDLHRILGDIDDAKVIDILALKPTLPEVEQAAVWAAGDGDVLRAAIRLPGWPRTSSIS